jgi:very-short-patch-repair endonuclease
VADENILRRRAKRLRREQTNAEGLLWGSLRDRRLAGYKFRRQVPIAGYIVDFLCIGGDLIIEVDGATHSTPEEIARDSERTRTLSDLGYRVLRIGNDDAYKNLAGVLATILDALERGLRRSHPQGKTPSSAPPGHLLPHCAGEKGK